MAFSSLPLGRGGAPHTRRRRPHVGAFLRQRRRGHLTREPASCFVKRSFFQWRFFPNIFFIERRFLCVTFHGEPGRARHHAAHALGLGHALVHALVRPLHARVVDGGEEQAAVGQETSKREREH